MIIPASACLSTSRGGQSWFSDEKFLAKGQRNRAEDGGAGRCYGDPPRLYPKQGQLPTQAAEQMLRDGANEITHEILGFQ
jgi:hypothetical protein